ncbi:methionyl-tRNA formyltransferase [Erythromicrobium ramosum]|uniref:Methionyl-tRNA formyltransferase n=1 Tax=Erythrobacter ramosus TaxID=35811 RepID=A0A6I4UL44_9SPHN|nr:methionyl-tRNA formyltransferase [Erythrobacter ramosus]MBB3776628.1 methionyl-tRNA formyltransferase [Erythrobacter ramosus]MXP38297.1 methionyl-tRNA formyltransferase [Erythrobacter ramosus]
MRIIFMGTPDFAVPALRALHAAGHEVVYVYTQPPRPAGRGKQLSPSPVQVAAEGLGIPVRSPVSLRNAEAQAEFAALNADVAVVAAYGLILPQAVLDAPVHGCLNIHASLLPRWRGAAPIHRAVMAGDAETGVTIMQMEAGLDTGPMLHKVAVPVGRKTTGELFDELGALGAAAIVEVLADLAAFPPEVQDDAAAIYAPKIDKAEAKIDWAESAEVIERLVRGLAPFPGAWFELGNERVKLLLAEVAEANGAPCVVLDEDFTIACGTGAIRPLRLQRAGKPAMSREEFLRGRPVAAGVVLS